METIIKKALIGVSDEIKRELLNELKGIAEDFISQVVMAKLARTVLKGIDEVIERSVRLLSADQVAKLAGAYAEEIDEQIVDLHAALAAYIPLQVDVEMAKKQFGKNSDEANAARALRAVGISEVRAEFRDLFASILGEDVKD